MKIYNVSDTTITWVGPTQYSVTIEAGKSFAVRDFLAPDLLAAFPEQLSLEPKKVTPVTVEPATSWKPKKIREQLGLREKAIVK